MNISTEEEIRNITSKKCADSIRSRIEDNKTHNDTSFYEAGYSYKPDHGTMHLSVLAPDGSAVSVTSSINDV